MNSLTYKNFAELQEQKPQIAKRLMSWGLQRKHSWGLNFKTQQAKVKDQIETYLDELVFTPTKFSQARDKFVYWGEILTDREKQLIGLLLPYELPRSTFNGKEYVESKDGKITADWYDGLYKVLDEPVLDKLTYKSQDLGLITENSYGAVILNTDNMMIIDIDLTDGDSQGHAIAKYPEQAITALQILEEKEGLSFRVYKTAGGLRAIETTKEWSPSGYDTNKLMKSVYADPLYVGLCWSQECFRARLTPKPWRISGYLDKDNFVNGRSWMVELEEQELSVCELISGDGKPIDDKFKSVIEYHDNVTKALISEAFDLSLA